MHLQILKSNFNLSEQESGFQCPQCDQLFENWFDLVSHCTEHGSACLPNEAGSADGPRLTKSAERKVRMHHKCELCYKAFASEERLQVGEARHDPLGLTCLAGFTCLIRFQSLFYPRPLVIRLGTHRCFLNQSVLVEMHRYVEHLCRLVQDSKFSAQALEVWP